jgi:hypothetical protein
LRSRCRAAKLAGSWQSVAETYPQRMLLTLPTRQFTILKEAQV